MRAVPGACAPFWLCTAALSARVRQSWSHPNHLLYVAAIGMLHALQNTWRAVPAKVIVLIAALIAASACGGARRSTATATPAVQPGTSVSFGFDVATPGPADGRYEVTGATWVIRPEPGAPSPPNALCRIDASGATSTVIVPSPEYADLTDSVSLEPLSAGGDGLILRAQDASDFYLIQADSGAGTISIEVERSGERRVLARVPAAVKPNAWQELSAQMRGTVIAAFLNGRKVAEASDSIFSHGSIGLWSAPNASACFDNLMATGL